MATPQRITVILLIQLASTIYVRQKVHPMNPYASNWLERLRKIKLIRQRINKERMTADLEVKMLPSTTKSITCDDFSDFAKWDDLKQSIVCTTFVEFYGIVDELWLISCWWAKTFGFLDLLFTWLNCENKSDSHKSVHSMDIRFISG